MEMNWKEVYKELAVPMPEEAVERSKAVETRKGYDTTGYGYQFCVNRFNDVLGIEGWYFEYSEIDRLDGHDSTGKPRISITMDCTITICLGDKQVERTCSGGHISNNYADARKGAITNSFKKTAALFGVGKAAYEGTIDDDNVALRDGGAYEVVKPQNAPQAAKPANTGYVPKDQNERDFAAELDGTRKATFAPKPCPSCGNEWTPRASYEKQCYNCYKNT